jgi:cytochrome P450
MAKAGEMEEGAVKREGVHYPPGPPKKFLGDRLFALQRDPLGYLAGLVRDYGDIVHFKIGAQHVVLLNDPDIIEDVLVTHSQNFVKGYTLEQAKRVLGDGLLTSEGEFHLHQRRLMQPIFHRQRIMALGADMAQYAARTAAHWQDGQTLDIARAMERLTLAVAAKTLLDADVEAEADEFGEAVAELLALFTPIMVSMADLLENLPIPPARRLRQSKARIDATIYRIIQEHRHSGDRGDLLSMLLLAQDEGRSGSAMTDVQVHDEALIILLAGYETMSNALAWTWYLLSQHPEVEARFHLELDIVLSGRPPTTDDLGRLTFTRRVLTESLRLYPPIWFLDRRPIEDYLAGGYLVPAGSVVIISQWLIHHDPRYYTEPFRFDPERWTPDAQPQRAKFAYFPFGGGPRLCIGEQFAWMEGVLLLAALGQQWRMRLVPGHPIKLQPVINLRPKHGIQVRLQRRSTPS